MWLARGKRDGEGVKRSSVVHFGERIDIGSLARRLTLAFWRGDWYWHFGEKINIGILGRKLTLAFLEQDGRLGSGSPGTRRSEAGQH